MVCLHSVVVLSVSGVAARCSQIHEGELWDGSFTVDGSVGLIYPDHMGTGYIRASLVSFSRGVFICARLLWVL